MHCFKQSVLLFFLLNLVQVNLALHSQHGDKIEYFSEVIGRNIRPYRLASRAARYAKDDQRLQFLFDSLVEHVVQGSYLDNFRVRKFGGRRIDLNHFKNPMYLITYADWCTPGIGEIPALNDIVQKNYNEIDFVVLF